MPLKYCDRFAKVHGSQYSVPVESEVIKTRRQTLRRVLNTFVSKTLSANFDIFPVFFFFLRPVKLRGSKKNIAPVPSFLYNSTKHEKTQKRRHRS